jgi:hypothetical protein
MSGTATQGLSELFRETAASLGHLVGQHLLVARLEIAAEARAMSRRFLRIAVLAALIAVGYVLAAAGLALVIGSRAGVGLPLVIIGVLHFAGAGAALSVVLMRARGPHLMGHTTAAVTGTVATLTAAPSPAAIGRMSVAAALSPETARGR